MNFMPKSSSSASQGFHEEENNHIMTIMSSTSRGKFPFSPSPSSSSSSPISSSPSSSHPWQKAFFPLSFHHHHQQPEGREGGEAATLELMETSSGGEEGKEAEDENNNNNNRQGEEGESDPLALGLVARGSSNNNDVGSGIIQKEHMFDKVVTPSDVGKLNRLVIPKQHAERYFPLDSSTNEKGLLLNFEDRNGKPWRFRYSYWNSSQSYVMTKGWSRFVKEKKLDAGDIVSFHRGVGDLGKDRLFIDWRRRPEASPAEIHPPHSSFPSLGFGYFSFDQYRSNHHYRYPWSSGSSISSNGNNPYLGHHHHRQISGPGSLSRYHTPFLQQNAINYHHPQYSHIQPQSQSQPNSAVGGYINSYGYSTSGPHGEGGGYNINPSLIYLRSSAVLAAARPQVGMMQPRDGGGGGVGEGMVYESVPVVQGKAAAKRLRLFGVNMDCPIPDQSTSDECASAGISPSSSIPLPQLRLYGATTARGQVMPPPPPHFHDKGKSSSLFDFDA